MTASPSSLARARKAAQEIEHFRNWVRGSGGSDLIAVCSGIGGETWAKRARLARQAVVEGRGPYVVRARVQGPLRLLRLGQAGRLPGIAGTTFVAIDPDDPRAGTMQTCIEHLERGLSAMQAVSMAGAAAGRRTAR